VSELGRLVAHLRAGQRFIVTSHQRPDGDAVGSSLGMALALRQLGKQAEVVMEAMPPHYLQPFPGVMAIRVATTIGEQYDGALIMECGSLERTGVGGLDRSPVLNIDHHLGNRRYGTINWIDESAAACTEMVFSVVEALGIPLSREVATHIYLGLLTDTGSFHFSHLSPRSFEIARRCVEAGVDPQWVARTHYNSNTLARVRIFGRVLNEMQLDRTGRVAALAATRESLTSLSATLDDTEEIVNFPLSVKDIQAVVFIKQADDDSWRVSMRSKGEVDVAAIARSFDGGGHKNAAGCTVHGDLDELRQMFIGRLVHALSNADTPPPAGAVGLQPDRHDATEPVQRRSG